MGVSAVWFRWARLTDRQIGRHGSSISPCSASIVTRSSAANCIRTRNNPLRYSSIGLWQRRQIRRHSLVAVLLQYIRKICHNFGKSEKKIWKLFHFCRRYRKKIKVAYFFSETRCIYLMSAWAGHVRRGGLTCVTPISALSQRASAVCIWLTVIGSSSVLGHFFHSWPENVASMRLAL